MEVILALLPAWCACVGTHREMFRAIVRGLFNRDVDDVGVFVAGRESM